VLSANKIPFEVVPGVSSAVAVPAYAGIPVTHRGVASSFTVVTGHKASGKEARNIAWDKLAEATDTLVVLMGIGNLENVVDQLTTNGPFFVNARRCDHSWNHPAPTVRDRHT